MKVGFSFYNLILKNNLNILMNENEIDLFKLDFSLFFSMKKSILKKLNLFLFPLFISNLCMAMNPK